MSSKNLIKKIAIVGPESTGKSTMAQALAKYYHTQWVPEYARYYCANLDAPCTLQDEINMFHGQLALEESVLASSEMPFIICDTTILTVKIWCDAMLGSTPDLVINTIKNRTYDLYLLMDIDLPWVADPLRDFPEQSAHFMQIWHQELQAIKSTYKVISGTGNQRIQNAVQAIDHFLDRSAVQ